MGGRAVGRTVFGLAALTVLLVAALSWGEPGLRPAAGHAQHASAALQRPALPQAAPDAGGLLLLVGVLQHLHG